jgi:hypothetical protein
VQRPVLLVVGVIVTVAGIVFTLQGVGVLSGSSMSNTATWSVLGPIIAIIGGFLVFSSTRPRPGDDGQ